MKPSTDSPNDALRRLWSVLSEATPSPPLDSITGRDYAKKHGLSARHSRDRLNALAEAGILKCGMFNRKKYYWLPEKKK